MTLPLPCLLRLRAFSVVWALVTAGVVLATAGCAVNPLLPAGNAQQEAGPVDRPPVSAAAEPPAAVLAPDPVLDDTPRIRARLDPADDAARTDLWLRVRGNFRMADLDNDLVRKWEQWYASRPDYVQRMTERGARYLFHIVEEVQRRDMPVDLALLPFIESAFNPQAKSTASASGMWQFMPLTGKDFELRQNMFRDDRRDVLASTRAALDYLQRLHGMFGDWHLALAAYNWGQGNVQRAIARNRQAGLPTDYDSLRMPDETRNYVPKLQAVKNIVARPEAFAVVLPALENHPFFLSVSIQRDIDVALAAQLADLPLDDFQALNPQMNKPVILAAGTPQVLLPYDNANVFLQQIGRYRGQLATWTAWVAPKTLQPAEAARIVGMSEDELRAVNRIPARMLVKAGSTLVVPRSDLHLLDVEEHIADNATMLLAPDLPPARKVSFKAGRKGDTVAAVARRYRVSPSLVAQWNGVGTGASFKPGQTVVVMKAAAPVRASRRTAKPAAAVRAPKAAAGKAAKPTSRSAAPVAPARKPAGGR